MVIQELKENRLEPSISPVYLNRQDSQIGWQPWGKEAFKFAEDANRLVMVVIALPQQDGFSRTLDALEKDSTIVQAIKDNYVPVLVDGDMGREMGLMCYPLCMEINRKVELPLFIWMTSEMNPVAWIPLLNAGEDTRQLFHQSHSMVEQLWKDSPSYVIKNSRLDAENRRKRLKSITENATSSTNPAQDSIGASRQLLSLYDPVSRTIDETGGLYPVGPLDVAIVTGLATSAPASLKGKALSTTEELLKDLLGSAMFDPLEGGLFPARSEGTWALPLFGWNCPDQAKGAYSLFRGHILTGNEEALDRAERLIVFAEKRFLTPEGLFSFGQIIRANPKDWMWTIADIRKALPAEDADWWIAATGMNELGNLPIESDIGRNYFRANTLGRPVSLKDLAARFSVEPSRISDSLDKSRRILSQIRAGRLKETTRDMEPNAGSSFRMVSAYAAAYTATGKEDYRKKAVELLERSRKTFRRDGVLKACSADGVPELVDARAFCHALAIQASQDVADITLDSTHLEWAGTIAKSLQDSFLKDGRLEEVSESAKVMDLPLEDHFRIFDDTTGGLLAISSARSSGGNNAFQASLDPLVSPLPGVAVHVPVLYTDRIIAALVKHHSCSIQFGPGLAPEMAEAVSRLPLQIFPRTEVSDGIPADSVRVISPDGSVKLIANKAELLKELMLSQKNP